LDDRDSQSFNVAFWKGGRDVERGPARRAPYTTPAQPLEESPLRHVLLGATARNADGLRVPTRPHHAPPPFPADLPLAPHLATLPGRRGGVHRRRRTSGERRSGGRSASALPALPPFRGR